MSADWPIVNLGDYCLKVGSGATPRGGASVYLDEGEICLIRSQNIYNEGFKSGGLVFITDESAQKLKNVIVEKNDVLLNITGDSVARVCLAKEEYLPARVNQHVAIIRPNLKEFDSRYLRYLLTSPTMQNHLLTIAAVGATRNALTKNMIETLEVSKPPLFIQKEIADHLERLDDKIELNRQTNSTLEEMAQSIFKSWFVNFEPTRAKVTAKQNGQDPESAAMAAISGKTLEELEQLSPEKRHSLKATAALFPDTLSDSELGGIPKHWTATPLYETAEYVNGGAFKSNDFCDPKDGLPIIKIAELKQGIYENTKYTLKEVKQRHFITNDDVLYSWSGSPETSLEVFKWFGGDGWLNQHIFKLNFSSDSQKYFTYYLLKHMKPILIATAQDKQTTGLGHVTVADMKRLLVPYPDNNVLDSFKELVSPLYEQCSTLEKECIELAELRDALLPELLSGNAKLNDKVAS